VLTGARVADDLAYRDTVTPHPFTSFRRKCLQERGGPIVCKDRTTIDDVITRNLIEMVKRLYKHFETLAIEYEFAYLRFHDSGSFYGVSGSYAASGDVFLMSPFKCENLFKDMTEAGLRLIRSQDHDRGVMLIVARKDREYKVHFEWSDLDRWRIDKLDGRTGIPEGFPASSLG